jgi:hypothetical protein
MTSKCAGLILAAILLTLNVATTAVQQTSPAIIPTHTISSFSAVASGYVEQTWDHAKAMTPRDDTSSSKWE